MDETSIRKLAMLARLTLSDDEAKTMAPQLERILGFIAQLSELNTDNTEPMTTALDVVNRYVPDQLQESLSREQALANSPHRDEECFLVPPVLGSS